MAKVVRLFGEQRAAEIACVGIDAVRKWRRRRATGGKGGLIPDERQAAYLTAAEEDGIPLTAADLIAEAY